MLRYLVVARRPVPALRRGHAIILPSEENGFRERQTSGRRGGLPDGGNSHQVQSIVNIGGWRQIAHRAFKGLVPHPPLRARTRREFGGAIKYPPAK
jgi:hypothetical protein